MLPDKRIYYLLKPVLPWSLRMALRRFQAKRIRKQCDHIWPIYEPAGQKPENWTGWPKGKRFALVLTHDVESKAGLHQVRRLAELEMELGFRSCFNFIPEGPYRVSKDLRTWLTNNGFEVGVHDFYHDGKLYSSREAFRKYAGEINNVLHEWGAVGFRSGFMHHNLEWLTALKTEYDSSTFDTDPFEPQPDGVNTIFPFWVPGNSTEANSKCKNQKPERGYVELPYTLPQDSTLFLIMREVSSGIWKKKVDWIAQKGGMVLVNTHPDYMHFDVAPCGQKRYPFERYRELLEHLTNHYQGEYWHVLPRVVAGLIRTLQNNINYSQQTIGYWAKTQVRSKIWIDLDNTPHVLFFEPIIKELKARGYRVLLTARDAYQVCEMADLKGFGYTKIGRHYGKNLFLKVMGTVFRALQLGSWMLKQRPNLGLSHGSRAQIFLCNLFRVPSILVMDYEFAKTLPFMHPMWEIVPDVIPNGSACVRSSRVRKFPGIKEDVYVPFLQPDPNLRRKLQLELGDIVVTVRPPATEAHYHNPESEKLFAYFMKRAVCSENTKIVLLPRNLRQREWILREWPDWFVHGRVIMPEKALDGLSLLSLSDLVVSGGGTMNREAAALGVPVYSIFRGPIGAVDRHLCDSGRLVLIASIHDVNSRILIQKRSRDDYRGAKTSEALQTIVKHVVDILDTVEKSAARS